MLIPPGRGLVLIGLDAKREELLPSERAGCGAAPVAGPVDGHDRHAMTPARGLEAEPVVVRHHRVGDSPGGAEPADAFSVQIELVGGEAAAALGATEPTDEHPPALSHGPKA
jgi:hypothetical protein